jgi:hypothetical protein
LGRTGTLKSAALFMSRPIAAASICQTFRATTSVGAIRLLFSFPALCVGVPNAVGEQTIEIRKVCITVDEEVQPFAIFFTRPLASPHFPSRIIAVEVRTAERRPAAVRTTFKVAAAVMALADTRATIGTGSAFHHPLPFPSSRLGMGTI